MKKLFLTLTAVAVSALTMYGQGRVAFNNEATFAPADAIIVGAQNMGAAGGAAGNGIGSPQYSVQLRWAPGVFGNQAAFDAANPVSSAVLSGAIWLAPTGPLATFSGFFDAGVVTTTTSGAHTMQVLAWYNTGSNPTYASALNVVNSGQSQLFAVNVTAPPAGVVSTIFPGFAVSLVPEPSTFALAGLGAAALLLFRRRK